MNDAFLDWQKDDYYALLGITRMAQEAEIRRAYRQRALECHPDRFPLDSSEREGAERRFRLLTEARDTLLDPQLREAYDREQESLQQAWLDAHRQQYEIPVNPPPAPKKTFKESLQKAYEKAQQEADFQRADFLVDDMGAHIYTSSKEEDALGCDQKARRSRKNAAAFYYAQGMRFAARGQYRRAWYALNNACMLDPELEIPPHVMNKIRTYAYYTRR